MPPHRAAAGAPNMEPSSMSAENNSSMDYEEHNRTYDLFINLTKYGTALVALILILMAIFLV